jgi:hypothetical protein
MLKENIKQRNAQTKQRNSLSRDLDGGYGIKRTSL